MPACGHHSGPADDAAGAAFAAPHYRVHPRCGHCFSAWADRLIILRPETQPLSAPHAFPCSAYPIRPYAALGPRFDAFRLGHARNMPRVFASAVLLIRSESRLSFPGSSVPCTSWPWQPFGAPAHPRAVFCGLHTHPVTGRACRRSGSTLPGVTPSFRASDIQFG